MESPGTPSISSISTALHESTLVSLGAADNQAQKAARLQQQNRPWMCSKIKMIITNDQCRASHARAEVRQCRDCGIPNILPKQEGQTVDKAKKQLICPECGNECKCLYGKNRECWGCYNSEKVDPAVVVHDAKKEPSQPVVEAKIPVSNEVELEFKQSEGDRFINRDIPDAEREPDHNNPDVILQCDSHENLHTELHNNLWEDFIPFTNRETGCCARIARGKIDLSAEASARSNFKKGDNLEFAYDQKTKSIAIRIAKPDSAYTVKCYKREGRSLQLSCAILIKKLGIRERKDIPVDFYPWGIVIKAGDQA